MFDFLYSGADIRPKDIVMDTVSGVIPRGYEFEELMFGQSSELTFLQTGEDIRGEASNEPMPRGYEFPELEAELNKPEYGHIKALSFLQTGEDIRVQITDEPITIRGSEFDDIFGEYYEDLGAYYDADSEDNAIFDEYARYMRNLYRKQRQAEREKEMQYTR